MAEAFLGAERWDDPAPARLDANFDPASAAAWADGADATVDLDSDGVEETVVFDTSVFETGVFGGGVGAGPDVEALVVASDTDLDGYTDRLSAVADDGEYGVWEFHRDVEGTPQWTRIDEGSVGDDGDHGRTP